MANEIRVRRNNIAGTTTNAPLAAGGTSITSANFVDLPVIDTTNHLILILDPLETAGAAEIVRVTAHSASSTTCTVVRGAENTTPREHALGTIWYHGPVTSDTIEVLTSSTRPAVPYTGEPLYETDTGVLRVYNGTSWVAPHTDPPACRVYHNANQSVTDNTVVTLAFNAERFDTATMHDTVTDNSRITIGTAGVYVVGGHAEIAAGTDYASSWIAIGINGGGTATALALSSDGTFTDGGTGVVHSISTAWKFAAGDYIQLLVYQNNTANAARNVLASAAPGKSYGCEFFATWIGRG